MEPCEELSDFDKGQVVGAIEMGLSVSKTAKMVGCSRAAVVSSYRQWHEKGLRLCAGRPNFKDPRELELELEGESDSEAEEEEKEEAPSKVTGGSVSQDVKPPQPDAERDNPAVGD